MGRPKAAVKENNEELAANVNFNVDFEELEESIIKQEENALSVEVVPRMDEVGWTDYVMSQFDADELEEGLPKVDGLRRLVRKLIGPILKGKAEVKQVPTIENDQRATVEYTLVVFNKYNLEDDEVPYMVEFTDAADAFKGNVKGLEFARFPTAMASTRAEVRALRKALNLGIVASEEISDQPLEEAGLTGKITESQITKIDIKCSQLDINVMNYINMGKAKYKKIEDVPNFVAIKMFRHINRYQQQLEPVPDDIKGYEPNWRGDLQ